MDFHEVFGALFLIASAIGIALALWCASETREHASYRCQRVERQRWSTAKYNSEQRSRAGYLERANAKIDASRRSSTSAAA